VATSAHEIGEGEAAPRATRAPLVILLLGLLYVISYLDRLILALLVAPVRAEFGVSDTAIALLLGPVFALFGGVFALPMGWLADRTNRARLILTAVLAWTGATIATAFAPSFGTVAGLRIGVAISEAVLFPAAISMIADLFPPARRAAATSAFIAFGVFGAFGAFTLGGIAVQLLGDAPVRLAGIALAPWRATFIVVALPGVALAGLFALLVREPARLRPVAPAPGTAGEASFLRRWIAMFVVLFVAAALGQSILLGVSAWLPSLLARSFGFATGQAGIAFGLAAAAGALTGLAAAPGIAGRFRARGRIDALPMLCAGAILVGGVSLLAGLAAPSATALLALVSIGCFFLAPSGTYAIFAINWTVPGRATGQLAATYAFINALVAVGLGPLVVAMVSDRLGGGANLSTGMVVLVVGAGGFAVALLAGVNRPFARLCRETPLLLNEDRA
jgi:MFS family permease